MNAQRWMWIAWPAFLVAGLIEWLVFALVDPVDLSLVPGGAPAVGVEILDFELCPRYSALVYENVKVRPSPLWLQCRLTAIGLNARAGRAFTLRFRMRIASADGHEAGEF